MTKRRKRIQLWLGVAVAVLSLGAAICGALQLQALAIVLSISIAASGIALLAMQHREPRLTILRAAGTDDHVWAGYGSPLSWRPPRANDPKPRRTGKKKEVGLCRAYEQDDGRWEIRVKGRRGTRGWIQESAQQPEGHLWHVKHPTQGWVGKFTSEEAAYEHLAAMR